MALRPPRQATACQWCRKHKVKCDTEQPCCRNCARHGVACVTVDLRKRGQAGQRQPPIGRRRRRLSGENAQRSSTKDTASPDRFAPMTAPASSSSAGSVAVYPLSPLAPTPPQFPQRHADALLPALFATPFDREVVQSPDTDTDTADADVAQALTQLQTGGGLPLEHARGAESRQQQILDAVEPAFSGVSPLYAGSGSQYVLVQWLDLFFQQNRAWTPVFPHMQRGLAYSVEMPLPTVLDGRRDCLPAPLPPLPPPATLAQYTEIFFARIHTVFPVLQRADFDADVVRLRAILDADTAATFPVHEGPRLACVYAVCSAAADEAASAVPESHSVAPTGDGTRYLQAACGLYSHLVAAPYEASVQALLLLVLLLRNRNRDGASWSCLGQAIRMAQALGIHRKTRDLSGSPSSLHARIWWTAYILERTMELETGRPSAIRDDECDQPIPDASPSSASASLFDYFAALARLAKIKARASRLLYGHRTLPRPSVRELLVEMGQIDRALLTWADMFPESIRPGRDIFCASDELPLATYVSIHFQQTMIALHRPALMSAPGFLRNRINEHCAGTPWRDRLHFSLCIGAAAARSLLKALNDLLMYAGWTCLVTANQVLLAVLVLGIYAAKVPRSRMNLSDVGMLDTFSELVADEYTRLGQDAAFVKGIRLFRSQLGSYIRGLRPAACDSVFHVYGNKNTSVHTTQHESDTQPPPQSQPLRLSSAPLNVLPELDDFGGFSMPGTVDDLEASWSYLWNEDVGRLLACDPADQDTTDMYLLGIPQWG